MLLFFLGGRKTTNRWKVEKWNWFGCCRWGSAGGLLVRTPVWVVFSLSFFLFLKKASSEFIAHSLGRTIWSSRVGGVVDGWKTWSLPACRWFKKARPPASHHAAAKGGARRKKSQKPLFFPPFKKLTNSFLRVKAVDFKQKGEKIAEGALRSVGICIIFFFIRGRRFFLFKDISRIY